MLEGKVDETGHPMTRFRIENCRIEEEDQGEEDSENENWDL